MVFGEEKFPVLNMEIIENLKELQVEDDPDVIEDLFIFFLTGTKKKLELLDKVIIEKNYVEISKISHAIRSSSLTIGADRVSAICLFKTELKKVYHECMVFIKKNKSTKEIEDFYINFN